MEHPLAQPWLRIASAQRGVSVRTLWTALAKTTAVLIAACFFLILIVNAVNPARAGTYFWDFRAFYEGGAAYLHGHSPYPAASLAALTSHQNFVYPLPIAALLAPVALLPFWLAAALFFVVNIAAIALTLRVLDVTDPRCYAVAFLGLPAEYALKLGTIMPVLALLLALTWRFRDRPRLAVPILALLVLAKVFLWPIGVWYLATRRVTAAIGACLLAVALVAVSALPVGLEPLRGYPHLLHLLASYEAPFSWSLTAFGLSIGLPPILATFLQYAVGGLILAAAVRAARRGDAVAGFSLAVAASLALSPIVWGHYLVLCLVPLALRERRFSPAWLATAWIVGDTLPLGNQRPLFILAAAAACAVQLRGWSPHWKQLPVRPTVAFACFAATVLFFASGAIAASVDVQAVALVGPAREASGSANLRLGATQICWDIWIRGVTAKNLELRFIGMRSDQPVATLASSIRLRKGWAEGCRSDTRSGTWRHEAKAEQFPYRLAVTSAGRVVLAGSLEAPVNVRANR